MPQKHLARTFCDPQAPRPAQQAQAPSSRSGPSKQDSAEKKDSVITSETHMKSSAPTQNKAAEMLPNEINVDDISGVNVEQDSSGKKVVFWEDPMVEGRHFNKSGKSPFMDMKLVPRHAE